MLGLAGNLSTWYGWPPGLAYFIGAANVLYGCYSGFLTLKLKRTGRLGTSLLIVLVVANSFWAGHCFTQLWWLREQASLLGLAHLCFEGAYLAALAYFEAKTLATGARQDV